MNKHLWRGFFSYRSEMDKEYAYAYSEEQARVIMCRRIAKKHEVHPSVVLSMFNGSKNNYKIIKEMEIVEHDE